MALRLPSGHEAEKAEQDAMPDDKEGTHPESGYVYSNNLYTTMACRDAAAARDLMRSVEINNIVLAKQALLYPNILTLRLFDSQGSSWTPLHNAAVNDAIEIFELVLNKAAIMLNASEVVNAASSAGVTPLMVASMFGRVTMVKLLLEYGAGVTTETYGGRENAVEWALRHKLNQWEEVHELLIYAAVQKRRSWYTSYCKLNLLCATADENNWLDPNTILEVTELQRAQLCEDAQTKGNWSVLRLQETITSTERLLKTSQRTIWAQLPTTWYNMAEQAKSLQLLVEKLRLLQRRVNGWDMTHIDRERVARRPQ